MKTITGLNSQQIKDIFNNKNNKGEYEVVVYSAFNEYPIKSIIKDNNKIIIITEEIGGLL